ncbi:MAG: trehalose-phosphatase [Actinomycetota bacterium]|nr:trehalose-phosphatase [Actinomycetota bacterium]
MSHTESRHALLEPLLADPSRSAILTDVDGTLAPIAMRPEAAEVPDAAKAVLRALADRFGLVACVTGRRALEARSMVGVGELLYVGNQGYELLVPGDAEPVSTPAAGPRRGLAADFVGRIDRDSFAVLGLRHEDKGPIQAIHWRGAADQEAAQQEVTRIARQAERSGLLALWGRKILELRPVAGIDKGTAVHGLVLDRAPLAAALFIGDDRTDLDAFRALRALAGTHRLGRALLVGVSSAEGPPEIVSEADLVVDGTDGVLELLRELAS